MKNYVLTRLNLNSAMLSLLNSKIPQSIIIKSFVVPSKIDFLIVDTAVRNKFTDMRFMVLRVNPKTRRVDWNSKKYEKFSDVFVRRANKILVSNIEELQRSFLTKREILDLVVNSE